MPNWPRHPLEKVVSLHGILNPSLNFSYMPVNKNCSCCIFAYGEITDIIPVPFHVQVFKLTSVVVPLVKSRACDLPVPELCSSLAQ